MTSYALAKRDFEHIAPLRFKYLVLDEAQHIKNPSSANAQICKSIAADHKLVLTGTPLENSAEDLWSIFDFLHPGMLGSIRGFKNRYAAIHTNPKPSQDLSRRISPFILRRTTASLICTIISGVKPSGAAKHSAKMENLRAGLKFLLLSFVCVRSAVIRRFFRKSSSRSVLPPQIQVRMDAPPPPPLTECLRVRQKWNS